MAFAVRIAAVALVLLMVRPAAFAWYNTSFVDSQGVPVRVAALEATSGFNSLGRRFVLTVGCYGADPVVRIFWDEPLADPLNLLTQFFVDDSRTPLAVFAGTWRVDSSDWSTRALSPAGFLESLVRSEVVRARVMSAAGEALIGLFDSRGAAAAVANVLVGCREAR